MGSLFSPKMPPLPPVQPAPEPPSAELSAEEKERIQQEQTAVERRRKGRNEATEDGEQNPEIKDEASKNVD